MLDAHTIHGFVQSCLQRKFDAPKPTPECHMEWWDLCCQGNALTAIAAPRKHAKSTAITLSYVLAKVLFRKSKFVVICSDTETQASLFLGDIKMELQENEEIVRLFGVAKFTKYSETDIIVEFNDGVSFRIMAKGAEQKLRGLKWKNKRPDLIVCDDMENDEAIMNSDRREKFRRWFYGALLPCRSNDGEVVVVGTILHMDSLLERLMTPARGSKLIHEELKSYPDSKNPIWHSVKYKAHNEDFSYILWPEQWSREALERERQGFLEQGLSDVYSREYLNYPIDESIAYFKRDDFQPLTEDDLECNLVYYTGTDFAVSTSDRSDYTVITTVGVTPSGDVLVVDVRRERWDAAEIIEQMFSVHRRFKPELFIVEAGAIEKAIGPFLRREMVERSTYLNLHPMVPTKDKLSRARSIQARMRYGGIRYDTEKTWYQTLEDEMVRFPRDRHDDQVDALSWIGLVLDLVHSAPTDDELAEDEYNQMNEDFAFEGRSPITGY